MARKTRYCTYILKECGLKLKIKRTAEEDGSINFWTSAGQEVRSDSQEDWPRTLKVITKNTILIIHRSSLHGSIN